MTKDTCRNIVSGLLCIALTVLIIWIYIKTPTVQYSHTTGRCVAVIPSSAGDCQHLPKHHNSENVK